MTASVASARQRFLLTFLGWVGGIAGGDRHLLEVASHWKDSVDLAVIAPPEAFSTIRSFLGDVQMHARGSAGPRVAARGPITALEYARRALDVTFRPPDAADVVVTASHFVPDAAALAALSRRGTLGVAYVYHLLADRTQTDLRTLWSRADEHVALRLLRKHAGVVFVSNRATESALAERGFAPVRTAVGVDLETLGEVSEPRRARTALFLARMVNTKGVLDAVEAWARVRRLIPDAKLVMAGDGPQREPGMRRAESLGIADAIVWPGFVPEDEKRRLLGESRLFLAPSYEEGWGISVAEALATGVPVAAYRLPVLDELFGSAYLAVPAGDVEKLGAEAARALSDQELAREMTERGRAVVAQYDVARVANAELVPIISHASRAVLGDQGRPARATRRPV
jgi:glycosyltransferase involved in cell wall biosynthesis